MASPRPRHDPTPREIIASARSAPAAARGALWLGLATSALMWASFTPLDFGPLAWICLVPLLLLVRLERPTRRMYGMIYLAALMFWLPALQWMRLGDPSMYMAWAALSFHMALFVPLFVFISRVAVHRLSIPMPLAVPVVWTGMEYLRGHLMTGYAWYYLGHTQYRWIELIQICDLTGVYGISFLIAAISACIAELIPASLLVKLKLFPLAMQSEIALETPLPARQVASACVCMGLCAAAIAYGYVRRGQAEFRAGPRVAAIQANFPTTVKNDSADPGQIWQKHEMLTGKAVQDQPDVIVWPETMFSWPLTEHSPDMTDEELHVAVPEIPVSRWHDPRVRQSLAELSQKAGAALVIGLQTLSADKNKKGMSIYNSAAFITPEDGVRGRYDKMHRVPFGEYLPLADTLPFLGHFTPFRGEYGIQAGARPVAFEYKGFRYAPVICFEDTIPHVVGKVVRGTTADDPAHRRPDVLLNLTNDGWFHGSSELDQHLITSAFRCVENRTPMVRAVNTGISALIDGDGVIRTRAMDPQTQRSKEVDAVLVETVPLDDRTSLYATYGDVFAGFCQTACGLILLAGLIRFFVFPRREAKPLAA